MKNSPEKKTQTNCITLVFYEKSTHLITRNQTNLFVCMVFFLSLLRIFTQKEMWLLPVKGYNFDLYLAHKVIKLRSKASLVYATNTLPYMVIFKDSKHSHLYFIIFSDLPSCSLMPHVSLFNDIVRPQYWHVN